jgi:predicted PurR-regulated permease PerM
MMREHVALILPAPRQDVSVPETASRLPARNGLAISMACLATLAILATLRIASPLLFPLFLSVLLSFVLYPAVRFLRSLGLPESAGAALVVVAVLLGLVLGVYQLAGPAAQWLDRAPDGLRTIEAQARRVLEPVQQVSQTAATLEHMAKQDTKVQEVRVDGSGFGGAILGGVQNVGGCLLVVVPLTYLLLASGDAFLRKLVKLLPRLRDKKRAVEISRESQRQISAYLFATTLINLGLGSAVALGVMLFGMPNALLWGAVVALLNFIPILGGLASVGILLIAGLLSFPDVRHALIPAAVFLVLHLLESNLIKPLVLGRHLALDPVVVFVGVVFWTWLWGIPGSLLAVPLISTLKIFCDRTETFAKFGEFLGPVASNGSSAEAAIS